MGVEDWETKYKLGNDNLLDDYLEPEQKTWDDDEETKSVIYRIESNPGDSKRSRFYQAVECEVPSPEANEFDEAGNSIKSPGVGCAEVLLVYKEAGSFEDETSPTEISIIPSVRKLHQQVADQEAYKESLLYKTRMWAKTHIQDILESYAIYQEKEEARLRARMEYESVELAEVHFSLGSEEDLDIMTFNEEDMQCEYDSYYNSRKFSPAYSERPHSYFELRGNVSAKDLGDVSPVMEPSDDYIDTMNELQNIVDTVTEYLAGREEEISKYEEIHDKSKMTEKEKDKNIKSDEVQEEATVEQSITEAKNAMKSLFSSHVGTTSTGATTDTTTTTTTITCSPLPPQPESGISKLLSFIPKLNGSLTPVAVVSPAQQKLHADKESSLQSLLCLQSPHTRNPDTTEGAEDTVNAATIPETQGSTASQSQSVVDSVLGRLSPFRMFGEKSAGEATSHPESPSKSHECTESKEGLTDKATLSIEHSSSQPEHQSSFGGSCSGSVELLPETESSGEIPDAPSREMTLKPEEQKKADDTGFFSPFKKSLTSFMTTSPASANKTSESQSGNSVFSIFKPAEASKPEDTPATIRSLFSSDSPATPQAPKQESGLLSGLLKLGPSEDATTSNQGVSNMSTKSPLLSRAMLLESVPKGNTDTGWFSNLFKTSPAESSTPQTKKPTATKSIPTVVVAPEAVVDTTDITVSRDVQEEQMVQEDGRLKSETDIHLETLTDIKAEEQCVIRYKTQADASELQNQPEPEEQAVSKPKGLLKVLSDDNKSSDKPQEGGLLSTLFSSLTSTTNESQAQQGTTLQSTGLFSGILKMAATENAGTGNEAPNARQQPVKSQNQLDSISPVSVQKHSQEQKATSSKSFFEGLFSKGSEEDNSTKLKDATVLSDSFKSESNESSGTALSRDPASTDSASLPKGGGLLSGLFKFASDTISNSPGSPVTTQGSNQPPSQTATPSLHQRGLLSGHLKLPGAENVGGTGNIKPDQQLEQPGICNGQQSNHKQPNAQSNTPPVQPQSGGLFGGILKLTESALAPSSTQWPSGNSSQPSQQLAETSPTGDMRSGVLNKISIAESTPQQSHLPAAIQDSPQQSASSEKGSFLSGLFGIVSSETNTGSQGCPQNVNSQQANRQNLAPHQEAQPSGRGGIFSGLFSKIVDTPESVQLDPNKNTAQQSSSSLLSGLFSTNRPSAQQEKSSSGTQINHQQQQQQQSNRQPLQRQNQIPVQPSAAPDSQQRGLISGLFNKLTSTGDTVPQHPVVEESPSAQACRIGHPAQDQQSLPNQALTEVFKTSTVAASSKTVPAELQQASTGLNQQCSRQAQQAPKASPQLPGAVQPHSQPGGLLSSVHKISESEELQQEQTQSNIQKDIKLKAQDCDDKESGILSGFFSKISGKTGDKSDNHIHLGKKTQQHDERKIVQNRPQIQRAKPIEQESTQDGVNEKEQRAPQQKGFLAGLFSKESEDNSLAKVMEINEPKTAQDFSSDSNENSKANITKESEKGFINQLISNRYNEQGSSVISGSKTRTQTHNPATMHPAVKSTQQYLEEVHRLLYGTATEYGYQDLLYLFAEHGIVPPELYEHQCLIEALLWQQLNDYAILEALEAQEYCAGFQEDAPSDSHKTIMQESRWSNLRNMDPKQFHIPSYPWQNLASSSLPKRLPQADAEDDVVFDMSVKSSCDNMDQLSNHTSRNHCVKKVSIGASAKLTRCQSVADCSISVKPVKNGSLNAEFDTSTFIKQLTLKKGPIDLTAGAVDLSSFSGTTRDTQDDIFLQDSEWYQQWLSLLEQGMWWPAEDGDCGYYLYADEDYIYSLLTDRSGKHLYAYSTQENRRGLEEIAENISHIMQSKDKPKTTLCGFKIPMFNEDERPWVPCDREGGVSSTPVDLSSAFEKGDIIMNMNLESFSEMLQDSLIGHPVDLSVYKLQKIEVRNDEPKGILPKEQMEASNLTSKVKKVNNGGPYWKNQGINDFLPEQMFTSVSAKISSQTTSIHQHSSVLSHPPTPEIKVSIEKETNKNILLNNFGDSSKMKISNTANSNSLGFKIAPQNQNAQRKLPDALASSKASTKSARSLPGIPRNIATEPSIVITTSSQMTLLSPQRSALGSQDSSGSPSSALSHRQQLRRQSSTSTQSLQIEGAPTCSILPQLHKVEATCHEKRPLPPPQNLLYNRPKQALDSLLRSKPLDFSESLRNKVQCPDRTTTQPLADLSTDNIFIEDILDFTKNKLKKARKKHHWICPADTNEDAGVDLTVEITEDGKEMHMTFPALQLTKSFPLIPEVPLRAVSIPPSPRLCPPDTGPSSSMYRTDQHSSLSSGLGSKLVRQVSVQSSKLNTTPEISSRESVNTSPKLSANSPGSKAHCGKDQNATYQGTSSSKPTSPEIKKYSAINLRSQYAQHITQPSVLNESIIPVTPQPCCKSTSPANLVRNTIDMSSTRLVRSVDKPTVETHVVPLVRSSRTSAAHVGDGSFGVPLIVDPFSVQTKQIQSQPEAINGIVPPLKTNIKALQASPILCRQQHAYNMNRALLAHLSQSFPNVSAPANSIKTTLDMCIKQTEGTVASSDEAVSLVRRRSRSTSGIIEEFGGISLVVEPLTAKAKPIFRRYQSQDTILKPTQQIVNMTSQIKTVAQHYPNTLYSLGLKEAVMAPANPLKATLDISANLASMTKGTKTSHIKILPDKNVLEVSEEIGSSEIKPLLRKYQSVETVSQNSSQNVNKNKTLSALPSEHIVKASLDISLKPAENTSSETVPLVKHKPLINITQPELCMSLDRSLKDLSKTKPSCMVKLVKTNSITDTQALQMSVRNVSQRQVQFEHTLPETPYLVLSSRSATAQLSHSPSAPANSIRSTLDMSLRTSFKEPDNAAGGIIEMSPGKVMSLVQTKSLISKKDLVGMPLIMKAFSAPKQQSQKELQAQKDLSNGHDITESHLGVQMSTHHSDRLLYSSLKQNRELQAHSKPVDFSVKLSHSQCNDPSSMQDGQLMDFILRNRQKHQQSLRTANQNNRTPIIDLTVGLDAMTKMSEIKDFSIPSNSCLPGQNALTSLAKDPALIYTTAQACGRKEPYVTQLQNIYPTVRPATPTNIKTVEPLENNFYRPELPNPPKPVYVLSVEQKRLNEFFLPQAQLIDQNVCCVKSDGPPVFRPVTNSSDVFNVAKSTLSTIHTQHSAQTQVPDIMIHPLNIPTFMQHDGLITQVTGCNRSLDVSRSNGFVKQSTVEGWSENTIQSWVPNLNSTTCVPEISHVLNISRASDPTSVVTFAQGQGCHNVSNTFTALSTDIPPYTIEQAVAHDISQITVISEGSLTQSGSAFAGSSVEPEGKHFLAINTAPKTQTSSIQTLFEPENTTKSVKGLMSKFDGTTLTAREDNIPQSSKEIQQRTGFICRSAQDQQMIPFSTYPNISTEVSSVKGLVSMSTQHFSTTPPSTVQSSMENPPSVQASLACTAVPFVKACTVKTIATPGCTAPPPLDSLTLIAHSNAAHVSEPSVAFCSAKNLSNPIYVASSATGFSISSPLPNAGYTSPHLMKFPPAAPLTNVVHTAEPSVTYSPGKLPSLGYAVTTDIRFSAPLPHSNLGNTAPTPMEFSPSAVHTVESTAYCPIELLPSSVCPLSLAYKGEQDTSVETPVCTTIDSSACTPVEDLPRVGHVVPPPMEPPPVALFPSTEHPVSSPIEFSTPVHQNISHTGPSSTVFSHDTHSTSFTTTPSVLDRPSLSLLQRKSSIFSHESNINRQVSKAPSIIITEVELELQEPSLVMLAQPMIPEKEVGSVVSNSNCEPPLMISDAVTNTTWNKSPSVVTVNNIHPTHSLEQIIPTDDHHETCFQSTNSQEGFHIAEFPIKQDLNEGKHNDSDRLAKSFSQKQFSVGDISSEMLFVEEVPCFARVLPTEAKERSFSFTRSRSKQLLIPHFTLKHPGEGFPSDHETMSPHVTGNDACLSVTEANEETKQQSDSDLTTTFNIQHTEMSEAAVSVHLDTSNTAENQINSSRIIIPEEAESNINVSAKTVTSLNSNSLNTEEEVSHSLLFQHTTLHEKESSEIIRKSSEKDECMLIKSAKVLVHQNKDISSFKLAPLDIMSPELEKSSEEKSVLEDQKLSPETSDIVKLIEEVDADVSVISIKEPPFHIEEHLTSESLKNRKEPSDFSEIMDISKEQKDERLCQVSSGEDQVKDTDVLSKENQLSSTAVPEEQSGNVIFSLFGVSSSQTQSGSSILGGILPGAATSKETTGTSLFSMFSGASQQTQASSAPKEVPRREKLLSMFSGSNVQQPLASCGPSGISPGSPPEFNTGGPIEKPRHDHRSGPVPGLRSSSGPAPRGSSTVGLPPRGQQSKESAGKGLFSMFGGPLTQQTLSSSAPSRPPASGAPNLASNLPGASTRKDNAGSGLFSMFGGSSVQSLPMQAVNKCSNTEPAGKGLFSRFGGTELSESESLFKVPSVFSLGGGPEKQKLSGFGLLSFMDDIKAAEPIVEHEATSKLEDIVISTSVNGEFKYDKSLHVKHDESEEDVQDNSVSAANENKEKISTETEIKSVSAALNPEDGKIPEDRTTAACKVTHGQIIEDSEAEIKTIEHSTEEKQQSYETVNVDDSVNIFQSQEADIITEEKALAAIECTHAQLAEKSETEMKPEEHPAEAQESLETEKLLEFEQNHTNEVESYTAKDTGAHIYFIEPVETEKSEISGSDKTLEAQIHQKVNKPVDCVSHAKTDEIPGVLEKSEIRELVDNKILSEIDEVPEKLGKSLEREETQNQDASAKGRSGTDKEADRTEQPKNDPFGGVVEREPAPGKEQEETDKQLSDMPAQTVSEPLSAVVIQPQPQHLPEIIGSLHKSKPRMVEPPVHLRPEKQTSFQKPPESTPFSGFMSMFSGPSASSKPATSSFFSPPQHSFFKLQPTGTTNTQQQHKTSFFNLPTNLPTGLNTESLKGDLFGLLKSKDAAGPEETKSRCSTDMKSSTSCESEAVASEQETVKDCERSDGEPFEESRGGNIEDADVFIKHKECEVGVMEEELITKVTSLIPDDSVVTLEKHPSSPTAKSMSELPGLSATPFGGLLSGAAATAKPFSSLFGSSTDTEVHQQPPDSGSLFASFKGFSAGFFQEDKSALPNEEPVSASSMFGKKLGFPRQSTAPSQTPATIVTTQVESTNLNEEPEIEILSVESDITESADSSDIEGPNDTYSDKQQGFDSSPDSLVAVKQDTSEPAEEDDAEDDLSLEEKNRDATDHGIGQLPERSLKKEHGRRLVGSYTV